MVHSRDEGVNPVELSILPDEGLPVLRHSWTEEQRDRNLRINELVARVYLFGVGVSVLE